MKFKIFMVFLPLFLSEPIVRDPGITQLDEENSFFLRQQ